MTEKEKVILKHTELAAEYARLSLSDQSLPEERWKKINNRMSAIQQEIEELREIERSWDDYQELKDREKSKLDMLTQDEVADMLKTSRVNVAMLREVGIIQATKTGKNYMFSQDSIKQFQYDYAGLDVSNRVKALRAKKEVDSKKPTQIN